MTRSLAALAAVATLGPAWGITWDFDEDGDTQGWVAKVPTQGGLLSLPVPDGAPAHLQVYSVLGQPVRTLVAQPAGAGRHVVPWDGRDDEGRDAGAGVYLYRLRAASWQRSGKAVKLD
ncbi:MAG: FlgD immunoglobulin-like domain containing protein [Candidatus Latescibacterota bacterium]